MSPASGGGSFALGVAEASAVYIELKRVEDVLGLEASAVLLRLERYLYDALSIDDLEKLMGSASR